MSARAFGLGRALERQHHDFALRTFKQHKTGFCAPDLGQSRRGRAWQARAFRDGELRCGRAGCDQLDQIGIKKKRRMLQHPRCNLGLIAGKPENDCRRGLVAESERAPKLAPHDG